MRYDDAYKKAGFTILPREGNVYPRGDFMLVNIVVWAMENPATYFEPLNLMVISKNIEEETDFLNALEALEDRYYNVLLALPQRLSSSRNLHNVNFQQLSEILLGVVQPVDQSRTFHHEWKSRTESPSFSYGLASVALHWESSEIHIFCDLACSTDFECIRPIFVRKGYVSPFMYIRTYTSSQDGHKSLKHKGEYDHNHSIVDERAKVTRMLLDVLFWAMNRHDVPQTLMIISKQCTIWDSVIKVLQGIGFIVIFGPYAVEASLSLDVSICFEECRQSQQLLVKSHGRSLSMQRDLASKYIVVLWLVDDCPPYPKQFMQHVIHTLTEKAYGNLLSMTAYVYKSKISDEYLNVIFKAGMQVQMVPEEEEDACGRITMSMLDMIERSIFQLGRANFLVISKPFKTNSMWRHGLYLLSLRDCRVFCELPDYMVTFGSCLWSAKDLLAGSSPRLE